MKRVKNAYDSELYINVPLLEKVKNKWRANPKELAMSTALQITTTVERFQEYGKNVNFCNTTGCLAGTAVFLSEEQRTSITEELSREMSLASYRKPKAKIEFIFYWNDIRKDAVRILGITPHQADMLFHFHHAPSMEDLPTDAFGNTFPLESVFAKLARKFRRRRVTKAEKTEIACAIIDRFVELKGDVFVGYKEYLKNL